MPNQKVVPRQDVKKMKQGMSYSGKEKTIILNVFKYFRVQHPNLCITEVVRRTSQATGCSEKSIFNFRKEEIRPEGFKEPSKTKIRKNININNRFIKYDKVIREKIKNVLYELKTSNGFPSLNTILKTINTNENLPNFSLMTLRRLLFDMGFYYERNGNKSVLLEKNAEKNTENNKVLNTNQPKMIDHEPTKEISNHILEKEKTNYLRRQDPRNTTNLLDKTEKRLEYEFPPQIQSQPLVIHERQNSSIPLMPLSAGSYQGSKQNHGMASHMPHMPMPVFGHRLPPYGPHQPVGSTGGNVYGSMHVKHDIGYLYHPGHHESHHHNML